MYAKGTVACSTGGCNLVAYGSERSSKYPPSVISHTFSLITHQVNSIVLITNGLSFAFQAVLFLAVGSLADYGVWRPHITTAFTVLTWAVSFGWLGVETASKCVQFAIWVDLADLGGSDGNLGPHCTFSD